MKSRQKNELLINTDKSFSNNKLKKLSSDIKINL